MHGSLLVSVECRSTMTTPFLITIMIECEVDKLLKYSELIVPNVNPQLLGIDSMVDATPPVLLCGFFQVT